MDADAEQIKQEIIDQKELMQNDIQALMDGAPEQIVDNVCQVVVDRMNIILARMGALPKSEQTTYVKLNADPFDHDLM